MLYTHFSKTDDVYKVEYKKTEGGEWQERDMVPSLPRSVINMLAKLERLKEHVEATFAPDFPLEERVMIEQVLELYQKAYEKEFPKDEPKVTK